MAMKKRRGAVVVALAVAVVVLLPMLATSGATINLVWLVDESNSIVADEWGPDSLNLEIDGLIGALDSVVVPYAADGNTVRMAVIGFGTSVHDRLAVLTDVSTPAGRNAVVAGLEAIRAAPDAGSTNMTGAISRAQQVLDGGPSGRGVVNLVTDGRPTSPVPAKYAALVLKNAGYELWPLGVTPGADNEFLADIAGPAPAHNFQVLGFADFEAAEEEKLGEILGAPEISLVKTGTLDMTVVAPVDQVDVGDRITYAFTVENTGDAALTNVTVSDPKLTVDGGPIASLAVGVVDATTFTGTYTLTQADLDAGLVENTATATGTPPSGPNVTGDDGDTVSLPSPPPEPEEPSISLIKNGTLDMTVVDPVDQVDVGDRITYAFTVENTGDVALTNVTVSDPKVTVLGGPIASLAVGAVDATTFTGTHTLTQADLIAGQVINAATATGTPPSGPDVTGDDIDTVLLPAPPPEPPEEEDVSWWYCGEHDAVCGSCPVSFCESADHWSVELATYADGEWDSYELSAARRFVIGDVTNIEFEYRLIEPYPDPQPDSGPSGAFRLLDSVTGDYYLAISAAAPIQTDSCTTFDADGVNWWWGPADLTDGKIDPDSLVNMAPAAGDTFANMQAAMAGYDVEAALVLMGVVGRTEGSSNGASPVDPGQALVDDVVLQWTTGGVQYGGTYHLERPWPTVVGFDDWTQSPLPGPEDPPREYERWCKCEHCLDVDDQNLWGLVNESDFDGLGVPSGADDFPSPDYALYFGNPSTGDYDMGERAIGCICSPWNELNPGDEYAALTFEYFREVEQYLSGGYDWTYVQIAFDNWDGLSYDPFGVENPGDAEDCADGEWKTIWYKDSRDASEGEWTEAVITHYLNEDNDPQVDSMYRITIPPEATRMKIRFCFNSEDGASNDYFGWLIDDIKKEHAPDPPGCRIITDYLPQAHVGEKYGDVYQSDGSLDTNQDKDALDPGDTVYYKLDPEVIDGSTVGPRSWSISSITKDGERMTSLPRRLALDPRGRLYGEPDPGTEGTYEITFLLECWNGRPDEETLILNITAPLDPADAKSMIDFEDFEGVSASTWTVDGQALPAVTAGCPNLWHETHKVKYALDTTSLQDEYGGVAYFGKDDNGVPTDGDDPNYRCSRAKGCLQSRLYAVTEDDHSGEELIIGFKSWRNVEYFTGGEYDKTWVDVRFEGGNWQTVWSKSSQDPPLASWVWREINTGLILQKGIKFQIRFCFDSIDSYTNGKLGECYGWLIDEVGLYAGSTNLGITNCPREEASVGDSYDEEIRASGGTDAFVAYWEVAAGELPPGLGIIYDQAVNHGRVAYIEGIPRTAGTYNFTIRVRSVDWTESATRDCTIVVGQKVTLLLEDFEDDPAWSQGGLWHFTEDCGVDGVDNLGPANHAAYYGQDDCTDPNYATGARTSGMLTLMSPVIDLTQAPGGGAVEAVKVEFDYWREVEGFGNGGYDTTEVQVQLDGGAWHTIWLLDSANPSMEEWIVEDGIVPFLTDGAERMLLRFVFDSVDKWYNDFVGWLVDNVKVESAPAGGANPLSAMASIARVEPRGVPAELSVMNVPNPIRGVHTTTFMVRSVDVDAMRIEIYDLSGALVFEEEVAGNELVWHTENDYGEYLANGIYLYRAYVLVDGEWVATKAQKLVILR